MDSRPCAFITGAATGIGRATARLFKQRGWFVGLADIDEAGLAALSAELGETHWLTENNPLERHHTVVDINLKGVLNGCYLAKPYLAKTPGARVINLSSTAAIYGQASLATYSTTKFAIRGLTEALNIEWQDHGIRVMDIMPLFVQTGMLTGIHARSMDRLGAQLTADDVAKVIWRAATYRGGLGKVHWPVGFMATWLFRLTSIGPDRLGRFIARQIAT